MERKIFKKSDKSRIRYYFNSVIYYWRLRSASNIYEKNIGCGVDSDGDVVYLYRAGSLTYILPTCSI